MFINLLVTFNKVSSIAEISIFMIELEKQPHGNERDSDISDSRDWDHIFRNKFFTVKMLISISNIKVDMKNCFSI